MGALRVAKSVEELKYLLQEPRRKELEIGFVPTMGAFHEGHLSLMKRSKKENDYTVVSIFVNPTQFAPWEDLDSYPRDLEGDLKKAKEVGVDIVFTPPVEEIYPTGFSTFVRVEGMEDRLCGAFRPGHFKGVATVVLKLFNLVKPKRAYFGLKDYQQFRIIERMVKDLNLDVEVVGCPTVREPDGLAMSSRNLYLSSEERRAATVLWKALNRGLELYKSGENSASRIREEMLKVIEGEALVKKVDYVSIVDGTTLEDVGTVKPGTLFAIALWIGKARLIDNLEVK